MKILDLEGERVWISLSNRADIRNKSENCITFERIKFKFKCILQLFPYHLKWRIIALNCTFCCSLIAFEWVSTSFCRLWICKMHLCTCNFQYFTSCSRLRDRLKVLRKIFNYANEGNLFLSLNCVILRQNGIHLRKFPTKLDFFKKIFTFKKVFPIFFQNF